MVNIQTYSKVWNSFSKWCRNQLEQERIVNIQNFALLSTKLSTEDGEKSFVVGLTDQFLSKAGMNMQQGLDLTYPVIKTNFVNLGKIAELDKQLC